MTKRCDLRGSEDETLTYKIRVNNVDATMLDNIKRLSHHCLLLPSDIWLLTALVYTA